ncbi:MAG TPA: DUF3459 domain-containing protein, partial [Candidatus Caenarcaniphilales bacterium]|nr:DUF3459 domain-containing protein [Candidatus Caenarcaniphilales bacterium]
LHSVLAVERSGYYADFGALGDVAATLTRAFRYAGDYSVFRERRHGRTPAGLPGHRFLGYLQNHDQIGNRATGERSSALMTPERLMIAAAVVLCSPFVPMLFQGEEWGASTPFQYFTDHDDPELGHAVSQGRRKEFAAFGWDPGEVPDPQAPKTFERSRLQWSELNQPEHARLLEWHRALVALRRSHPELTDGSLDRVEVAFDERAGWLYFRRGSIAVAFNLAQAERVADLGFAGDVSLVLASSSAITVDAARVSLPPDSVAVVQLAPSSKKD